METKKTESWIMEFIYIILCLITSAVLFFCTWFLLIVFNYPNT